MSGKLETFVAESFEGPLKKAKSSHENPLILTEVTSNKKFPIDILAFHNPCTTKLDSYEDDKPNLPELDDKNVSLSIDSCISGNSKINSSRNRFIARSRVFGASMSMKVNSCNGISHKDLTISNVNKNDDEIVDPRSAKHVARRVTLVVQKWGTISAIPPDKFLHRLLSSRGYSVEMIPAMRSEFKR
jgi:hypothetical protein